MDLPRHLADARDRNPDLGTWREVRLRRSYDWPRTLERLNQLSDPNLPDRSPRPVRHKNRRVLLDADAPALVQKRVVVVREVLQNQGPAARVRPRLVLLAPLRTDGPVDGLHPHLDVGQLHLLAAQEEAPEPAAVLPGPDRCVPDQGVGIVGDDEVVSEVEGVRGVDPDTDRLLPADFFHRDDLAG